ncbi:hypothetical protein A6R68_07707, partial [Neotoma lepida]
HHSSNDHSSKENQNSNDCHDGESGLRRLWEEKTGREVRVMTPALSPDHAQGLQKAPAFPDPSSAPTPSLPHLRA